MTEVKLALRGLRGESIADIARRVGEINGQPVAPDATDDEVINLAGIGLGANVQPILDAVTEEADRATLKADLAAAWAEGTTPGGPGTDSAKGWALSLGGLSFLGGFFKRVSSDYLFGQAARIRIGNRLYATIDAVRGVYPRKLTLPASARVDDDLSQSIVSRLINGLVGPLLKPLKPEQAAFYRWRVGNRLLGIWTLAGGFTPSRATLPRGAKVDDQPGLALGSRLSAADVSVTANHVALVRLDAGGLRQVETRRRSDGAHFQITSGASAAYEPFLTPDARVLFWSDGDGRYMHAPATGGTAAPVDPINEIVAWGDSLTAQTGSGGSGTGQGSYSKQLKDRLGSVVTAVINQGVSGQTPAEVASRQGGANALLTVASNLIPTSGAVSVTSWSVAPVMQFLPTIVGTLAGVPGTLTALAPWASFRPTAMTFTRTTPGTAVACPPGTPFIADAGVAARPKAQLYVVGRNDYTQSTLLAAIAAMVGHQSAYCPQWLVGSVLAQPGDLDAAGVNAANAAIAAAYPGNYVDLNSAPTTEEMALIGFVPDSYGIYSNGRTDAADIAANFVPSGMRRFGDNDYVHLNDFGNALFALRFYRKIHAMRWFPSLAAV